MRWSGALGASAIGACTFGLALAALTLMNGSLGHSEPSIAPTLPSPVPPTAVPAPAESLATRLSAGRVGIGAPLTPDTAPLAEIRVGAVLDVLATVAPEGDRPASVGQVVSDARVLELTSRDARSATVLLDVSENDGILLGYLVRRGIPLTYAVRTATERPAEFSSLSVDEARKRLGIGRPAIQPTAASTAPAAPQPDASEVHFIVYDGVDLPGIEQRFGISEAALLEANPDLRASEPLVTGSELRIPDLYGFYYRVQPGDTWATLVQRHAVSGEELSRINALSTDDPPQVGAGLLIPAQQPDWARAAH